MFNVDYKPVFTTTVTITAPGQASAEDFSATFEAIDLDESQAFDLATAAGAKGFLERVLLSVDDIIDNKGNVVPDSLNLRAALIAKPWVRSPMIHAYMQGIQAAAVGNS